jgi:hypothetical protein
MPVVRHARRSHGLRVAVIGTGTLDSLPHNGVVVTLLAVCGSKHREGYRDIVITAIVGPITRACRRDRAGLRARLVLIHRDLSIREETLLETPAFEASE